MEQNKFYQIKNIIESEYILVDCDGNIITFPIQEVDKIASAFTLQDAKDGDVLFQDLMDGKTFIYNGINPDTSILYSFIISNDGKDVLSYHIGKPNIGIGNIEENKNIIHPATKEQRDLLFSKMKEVGYEWDADKKELSKIKMTDLFEDYTEQEPVKWNKEDEENINNILYILNQLKDTSSYEEDDIIEKIINWVKSLKERIGG